MVILCGGLATRLGDIAKDTPKSMVKIEGKPFLEYQIDFLRRNSIKDIILCVGHLSETIENYFKDGKDFGVNITYSHDGDTQLGPIGAVKNANPLLEDIFFILYGDSFLTVNFKDVHSFFLKNNKLGLMCVFKNYNQYDKSNIAVKENLVTRYNESSNSKDMVYIDYGTSILKKESLDRLQRDKYISTGEFFIDLIKDHELLAYEVKERFYHIGNPDALEEFRVFIRGK
jgi:NDP-sugar pyrophosphorylase family protein